MFAKAAYLAFLILHRRKVATPDGMALVIAQDAMVGCGPLQRDPDGGAAGLGNMNKNDFAALHGKGKSPNWPYAP